MPLPEDVAALLAAEPDVGAAYRALSFSKQRALIEPIGQAKTAETRQRRSDKALETLRSE